MSDLLRCPICYEQTGELRQHLRGHPVVALWRCVWRLDPLWTAGFAAAVLLSLTWLALVLWWWLP